MRKVFSFPIFGSKQTREVGNEFSHFPLSSHFHESKHALRKTFIMVYPVMKLLNCFLCSTNASIIKPCRVQNVSDTRVEHT